MNENEVMTNEIEEMESNEVAVTNTEVEETNSGSGLMVGVAVGALLTWGVIAGVKKAKTVWANHKAKKKLKEAEVFEPDGTEEVVESEDVTEEPKSDKKPNKK